MVVSVSPTPDPISEPTGRHGIAVLFGNLEFMMAPLAGLDRQMRSDIDELGDYINSNYDGLVDGDSDTITFIQTAISDLIEDAQKLAQKLAGEKQFSTLEYIETLKFMHGLLSKWE